MSTNGPAYYCSVPFVAGAFVPGKDIASCPCGTGWYSECPIHGVRVPAADLSRAEHQLKRIVCDIGEGCHVCNPRPTPETS